MQYFYLAKLHEGLASNTVSRIHATLSRALNDAASWQLVRRSEEGSNTTKMEAKGNQPPHQRADKGSLDTAKETQQSAKLPIDRANIMLVSPLRVSTPGTQIGVTTHAPQAHPRIPSTPSLKVSSVDNARGCTQTCTWLARSRGTSCTGRPTSRRIQDSV